MRNITSQVAFATLLLASLVTASAHGSDEPMNMNDGTNMAAHETSTTAHAAATQAAGPMSYFAYGKHSSSLVVHVSLMIVAWCFVFPAAVMLSIARSRLALPSQFLFTLINAFGLLFGIIYNSQTPDLYENNVHHKIGWVITWVVSGQVILSLIFAYAGRGDSNSTSNSYEETVFLPVATDEHQHTFPTGPLHRYRWSRDSGQGTESNSSIHSPGSPCESAADYDDGFEKPEEPLRTQTTTRSWLHSSFVDRFLSNRVPGMVSNRVLRGLNLVYNIIDRIILPFGFVAIATGGVTYGGIMRQREVFNGAAHFIKGGIFFWYGILTLGRYVGCWADLGWAWNRKPGTPIVSGWKARVPSGEFVECFTIFFYGITNVFLEHLSNWGEAWSTTDLEHVSISILFLGGGLVGMLFESSRIRDALNNTILRSPAPGTRDEGWQPPKSQAVSLNPMPALIILLLGMMMGSHHQSSMTSTMVHKQWGDLLVGFALARGMTYVLLFLRPPTSYLPARPPTEIVAGFCLMGGGLIFMLSTRNVIQAMEFYEADAMFTFTVGMGFTAFVMALEILFISLKAWAVKREQRSQLTYEFS
ncbi:hypothetical protein N7456_012363 [Penicillium angulare]|uniref:Integral membrane protein n=1 Tax=Penicillium angulare TaxID=116970 RepID=A0A9W9EVI3_9EURO|nr:hypothetical protein N7456_012363 [Penicillium angulare]